MFNRYGAKSNILRYSDLTSLNRCLSTFQPLCLWVKAVYHRPYNAHRHSGTLSHNHATCAVIYLNKNTRKHPPTHIEAVKIGGAAAFKIAAIFVDFWHTRFFALICPINFSAFSRFTLNVVKHFLYICIKFYAAIYNYQRFINYSLFDTHKWAII